MRARAEQPLHPPVGEQQQQQRHDDHGRAAEHVVQHRARLADHDRIPIAIDVGEALARVDALVAQRDAVLIGRDAPREAEDGIGLGGALVGRCGGRRTRSPAAAASGRGG